MQLRLLVSEEDGRGVDAEQRDGPSREGGQDVHDIELDDEVVGQLDECPRQELLSFHHNLRVGLT